MHSLLHLMSQLAFELGEHEYDIEGIFDKPLEVVIEALTHNCCYREMVENFPDMVEKENQFYDTKYCKVQHLRKENAILCKWKQFCKGDDYREPFRYALKEINKHNISTWITDTTHGFENEEVDTKWLLEEFMPLMIESSVKKIIFVIAKDSLLMDEIKGQEVALKAFFEVVLVESI